MTTPVRRAVEPAARRAGRARVGGGARADAAPVTWDPALGALRVLALGCLVVGHWLVSALVLRAGGHLAGAGALAGRPWLASALAFPQPLAVLFLLAGHAAARGHARAPGPAYRAWVLARTRRLLRPLGPLVATWTLVGAGLLAADAAPETLHALLLPALAPSGLLLVHAVLSAAAPLMRRRPVALAVAAVLLLAAADVAGTALRCGAVEAAGLLASCGVPYLLGTAWSDGALVRRRFPVALLVGGGCAAAVLVLCGGRPVATAVPGADGAAHGSLALTALLGSAQCGGAILLCGPPRRLRGAPSDGGHPAYAALRRPAPGARAPHRAARQSSCAIRMLARIDASSTTLFLWHPTAMLAVAVLAPALGHPPAGLATAPGAPGWLLARCAWLPVFAAVLALLRAAFHQPPAPTAIAARAARPVTRSDAEPGTRAAPHAPAGVRPTERPSVPVP